MKRFFNQCAGGKRWKSVGHMQPEAVAAEARAQGDGDGALEAIVAASAGA